MSDGINSDLTDGWISDGPVKTLVDALAMLIGGILAGVIVAALAAILLMPLYHGPGIAVDLFASPAMGEGELETIKLIGFITGAGFDLGVILFLMIWLD